MKVGKRFVKGVLVLSVAFLFGACGNGTDTKKADSESSTAASSVASSEEEQQPVVIYVTRHGKTMFNTVKRAQGWADTPLTDAGVEVAEALGRGLELQDIHFAGVYSSDAGRARETARLVLENSGQPSLDIIEDKRLREFCFGIYEGDTDEHMWGDVGEKLGYPTFDAFMEAFAAGKIGMEESVKTLKSIDTTGMAEDQPTVKKRMQAALKEIAEETEQAGGGNVLLVAHGMSILAMISDLTNQEMPGQLENASVTKIVYEKGEFTVETIGDMSYVEAGEKE